MKGLFRCLLQSRWAGFWLFLGVFVGGIIGKSAPLAAADADAIYARACAGCHGVKGNGEGPVSAFLDPPPRDFTRNVFKFGGSVSEIERTIARGIPGTSMPGFSGALTETEIDKVAAYVRRLTGEEASEELTVPKVPEGIGSVEEGAKAFAEHCARCHGGEGAAVALDELRFQLKGGERPEDLYKRIVQGIPGTPMPAFGDRLSEAVVWDLVAYVRSLRPPRKRGGNKLVIRRIEELPKTAASAVWDDTPPVNIALHPTWIGRPFLPKGMVETKPDLARASSSQGRARLQKRNWPHTLEVRALHDGEEVAVLLEWSDATANRRIERWHFVDGVAFMLPNEGDQEELPFIGMGTPNRVGAQEKGIVRIWHWRAFDKTLEPMKRSFTFQEATPYSRQPERQKIPSLGAKNPIAETTKGRKMPEVLEYVASGPGSLTRVSEEDSEGIHGAEALRQNGHWRVLITRRPKEGKELSRFTPGSTSFIGFAVWDGEAGERNGFKSVTRWVRLEIAE